MLPILIPKIHDQIFMGIDRTVLVKKKEKKKKRKSIILGG